MSKRVLVVDDDPDILEYVSMLLGDHGYEVRMAESAEVAAASLQAGAVDVVVLDVQLQGRSGLDLLVALRADPRHRELRVILLTGDDRVVEDGARSYASWQGAARGPDAILGKPLSPAALLATLERLLAA